MMRLEDLARELNRLIDEGKGECLIDILVPNRQSDGKNDIMAFQITGVLDEALEVGCISITGKEHDPLPPPPPTDGMMLP